MSPTPPGTRFHVPLKSVLAFGPEKVHVGFKLEFEDVLLVDAVRLVGRADGVAEQRQARQREVVLQRRPTRVRSNSGALIKKQNKTKTNKSMSDLVSLIEEQAEVGENNPEFLPAITVLELP